MKDKVILGSLVALAGSVPSFLVSGCAQKAQALPPGSIRVVVKDLVSDSSTQVEQITIEKEGPGKLRVNAEVKHSGFVINTGFDPRSGDTTGVTDLVFVADTVPSSQVGLNVVHLVCQVTTSGSVSSGSYTGQTAGAPKTAASLLMAVQSGTYPLGTPLQVGLMRGKPITLTVSEGKG